ncbi:MAG: GNAT family N-acetyltransferase [Flavobacteriales bacterium]|nr:GNAT family N-acetyltransferase [Flavobacteriales bacterium]
MAEQLGIHEITPQDVDLITSYWAESDDRYLEGMGVDLGKMPDPEVFREMLNAQISKPIREKQAYALIWTCNDLPIGHNNINQITFGKQANMHLHIWKQEHRKKGWGVGLVRLAIPVFFEKYQLERILCEPYALNPAPHKLLEKIGFEFVKTYTTIPGSINFEQEVHQWVMTREHWNLIQ